MNVPNKDIYFHPDINDDDDDGDDGDTQSDAAAFTLDPYIKIFF